MRDGGRGWAICTDRGSAQALSRKGLKFSRLKFPGPGMCTGPVLRKKRTERERTGGGGEGFAPDHRLQRRLALRHRSHPRIKIHGNRPGRLTTIQSAYLPAYIYNFIWSKLDRCGLYHFFFPEIERILDI